MLSYLHCNAKIIGCLKGIMCLWYGELHWWYFLCFEYNGVKHKRVNVGQNNPNILYLEKNHNKLERRGSHQAQYDWTTEEQQICKCCIKSHPLTRVRNRSAGKVRAREWENISPTPWRWRWHFFLKQAAPLKKWAAKVEPSGRFVGEWMFDSG